MLINKSNEINFANITIELMLNFTIKGFVISCAGLLILAISAPKILAQKGYVQEFYNPSSTITTKRNEKIHGTPFFNENWEKGRVMLTSDEKTKTMDLKYKIFSNELLFKKNGRSLAVRPRTIKGFYLEHDGEPVVFTNGISVPQYDIKPTRILQVIYSGNVKVYKRLKVKFHRGQNPDPYTGVINSNFRHYEDYFLLDSQKKLHKVKLKEDDILNALSSHKDELRSYAKANDLDFDDGQDLNKILQEYDKMIEK